MKRDDEVYRKRTNTIEMRPITQATFALRGRWFYRRNRVRNRHTEPPHAPSCSGPPLPFAQNAVAPATETNTDSSPDRWASARRRSTRPSRHRGRTVTETLVQAITRHRLLEVAEVYRKANVVGGAPTKAVAEHFDAPYDTAKKWVRRARVHVRPRIGGVQLEHLDAGALKRMYAELGETLSPRSLRYAHAIIHRALKDAVLWGRIVRSPADVARPP